MERELTVILYIRVSMEDRDIGTGGKEESDSVVNQRNLLRGFIRRKPEFQYCRTLELCDDGYTGLNFDRPAVQELLRMAKEQVVDCVIVKDFSRFGRDYLTVSDYVDQIFPLLGVRFISVNDGYDSSHLDGITSGIDMAFRNVVYSYYSKDISEKTRSGKRAKARQGAYLGPFAPIGYQKDECDKNHLVVEERAAAIVCRIFRMCGSGRSVAEIARLLNAEKVPTPSHLKRAQGHDHPWWNGLRKGGSQAGVGRDMDGPRTGKGQEVSGSRVGMGGEIDGPRTGKEVSDSQVGTGGEIDGLRMGTGQDMNGLWAEMRQEMNAHGEGFGLWDTSSITRILRDERYLGSAVYGKKTRTEMGSAKVKKTAKKDWVVVPGCHEPIVTIAEFEAAARTLRRYAKANNRSTAGHRFTGKIRCGNCGYAMVREEKKIPGYRCPTPKRVSGCGCMAGSVPEPALIEIVWQALRLYCGIWLDVDECPQNHPDPVRVRQLQKQAATLQGASKSLDTQKATLYERMLDGKISREQYLLKRDQMAWRQQGLRQEIDGLEQELCGLREPESALRPLLSAENALRPLSSAENALSAPVGERSRCLGADGLTREMVQVFVGCVYVFSERRLRIEWKFGVRKT